MDVDPRVADRAGGAARERLSERLRLVPIGRDRAGDMWALHWHEQVAAWYHGRYTAQEALDKATDMGEAWRRDGVNKWMAYDRDTGELVGRGGISRTTLPGSGVDGPVLEVGWVVRPDRWGRGYATEIARAALAFGFDELAAPQIVAFAEVHNRRSRAVMERVGLSYRRDFPYSGVPFALYGIDRETYAATDADQR